MLFNSSNVNLAAGVHHLPHERDGHDAAQGLDAPGLVQLVDQLHQTGQSVRRPVLAGLCRSSRTGHSLPPSRMAPMRRVQPRSHGGFGQERRVHRALDDRASFLSSCGQNLSRSRNPAAVSLEEVLAGAIDPLVQQRRYPPDRLSSTLPALMCLSSSIRGAALALDSHMPISLQAADSDSRHQEAFFASCLGAGEPAGNSSTTCPDLLTYLP